jgi:hypothetical protein
VSCCSRCATGAQCLGSTTDTDLGAFAAELQRGGREWFFGRIKELSALGVAFQRLAVLAEQRSIDPVPMRDRAEACRRVNDGLYWIVDTYLGGVEALPNKVSLGAPALGVALPAAAVLLKALGIVTAAALVAWIAAQGRQYAEFAARIDAAKETGDPDFLPTPEPPSAIEAAASGVGLLLKLGGAYLAYKVIRGELDRRKSAAVGA